MIRLKEPSTQIPSAQTQYNMVTFTSTPIEHIRSNHFLWVVRFLQGIFAIAILGICASPAHQPGKT